MRALGRLLLGLLLAAPLAGCLSEGAPLEGAGADASEGADAAPQSPDGRGPMAALEETNATETGAGGTGHRHDPWGGASRVTVFDMHALMRPMDAHEAATYEAASTFRPEQGRLVFEGTERVEFTVSNPERHVCPSTATVDGEYVCTDTAGLPRAPDPSGGPAGLKLRYKHAATADWIDVGELTWGAPLAIVVTDSRQTDMPHATSSFWEFQVASPRKEDATLTFTAKADLVRGDGEIPLWPGHPDFYPDGVTSRTVLETRGAACAGASGCALAEGDVGALVPDRLVSHGTRTLHVWLNITEVQAPNPALAPTSWFLYVHNATGREGGTNPFSPDHAEPRRELLWVIQVDDGGMDSPYADGSRWGFRLGGALSTPVASCDSGCAEWAATFDVKIVASSVALPPEAYHAS